MSVQIIINGDNAAMAVKELLILAQSIGGGPLDTAKVDKPDKPAKNNRTKPPETPPEKVEDDADQDTSTEDGDSEDIPTDVELRAKVREVVDKDATKKPLIKPLLTEFGVLNVTAVPDESRVEFMQRLNAL